jgi:hypothetical protein
MKAFSVKQPYASLIAEGKKTIETRKWQTKYRGDMLICASKKWDMSFKKEVQNNLPLGVAIAIVELYDIRPMELIDEHDAYCEPYPGAYSWFLRNIRPIEPFEVKGALSLFEVPDELIKELKCQ